MITNGIEIRCDNDYNRLPVSPELRSLIRQVHQGTGARFEAIYLGEPTRYERRSSPAPSESFYRPSGDLANAQQRLRLKLALLARM
jgi:hypothetical protein